MKIDKFEDVQAWQEARELVKKVYKTVERNPNIQRDFRYKAQLTSSAISGMSNVAEGFSRRSDKEFIQFLFVSKGSLAELQSLLYAAMDLDYLSKEDFNELYVQADKTSRLISKFISYLKTH